MKTKASRINNEWGVKVRCCFLMMAEILRNTYSRKYLVISSPMGNGHLEPTCAALLEGQQRLGVRAHRVPNGDQNITLLV